jgi:hypothetical protein
MEDTILILFIGGVIVAIFGSLFLKTALGRRKRAPDSGLDADKAEAFFQAGFPELQPLFHPQAVVDYVLRRRKRQYKERERWENPAGFPAAALARFEAEPKGERTHLYDKAGVKIADFLVEPKEGALAAVRVGAGKFTIRQAPGQPPRVSYWHPEREFQWKGRGQWRFVSRVADEPVDTTDRSWSGSTSSSSSTTTAAAAAAGVVSLGGTFDGGGASAGWDGPDGSSASGAGSGDSDFPAVSSGSSSTAESSGSSGDASGSAGDTSY